MWCLVVWLAALSLSGGVAALSGPTDAVRSLLHSSPRASSVAIDAALDALANPTDRPAFASRGALAAGTWRVVHAPHIGTLGRTLGGLRFDVTYELDDADRMTSHVRYTLALPGAAGGDRATAWTTGWLSTAGTWEALDADTVRVNWEQIWWNPGMADAPSAPERGALAAPVQALGRLGFMPGVSTFPVEYVDADLCMFRFALAGTRIAAAKVGGRLLADAGEDDDAPAQERRRPAAPPPMWIP